MSRYNHLYYSDATEICEAAIRTGDMVVFEETFSQDAGHSGTDVMKSDCLEIIEYWIDKFADFTEEWIEIIASLSPMSPQAKPGVEIP